MYLHRHPTEPHTYVAVQRYRDTDAVTAHAGMLRTSAKRWGEFQDWLAKPVEFLQLHQIVPS